MAAILAGYVRLVHPFTMCHSLVAVAFLLVSSAPVFAQVGSATTGSRAEAIAEPAALFSAPVPRTILPATGGETTSASRWKISANNAPGAEDPLKLLFQRGEYSGAGYSLTAEMGTLAASGSPGSPADPSMRGGRIGFFTGNSHNTLRLQTFVAPENITDRDYGLLVGALGEASVFSDTVRFKTRYLNKTTVFNPEPTVFLEKKGNVLGLHAVLEPIKGLLALEAEADYSEFDPGSVDVSALRDRAYRAKIRGASGSHRYSALYEFTGPHYYSIGERGRRRDSEGIAFSLGTALKFHAVDINLSRYNDNTGNIDHLPRLYRYEGSVDYKLKVLRAFPLGLQYRKILLDGEGAAPGKSDSDNVSLQLNCLAGKWDLGLRASYFQRTDRVSDDREVTATALGFSPKVSLGSVTLTPDLSLKHTTFSLTGERTNEYGFNLDIKGIFDKKVDYEMRGGFRKTVAEIPSSGKGAFDAKVRVGYPLARLLRGVGDASLGLKGDFSRVTEPSAGRSDSTFSLLFMLDGSRLL